MQKKALNDCIFCKIAAGQIKASVVQETDLVIAFNDISPQAPVHILIIPKKHIFGISTLEGEDFSLLQEIHRVAQDISRKEPKLKDGFRLVINSGPNAGQSVGHLHYHLLGGRKLAWPPG